MSDKQNVSENLQRSKPLISPATRPIMKKDDGKKVIDENPPHTHKKKLND